MRVVAIALALAAACKTHDVEPKPEAREVHCTAAIAETERSVITLRGAIAARPDKDSVVASEIAGRIRALPVREGDAVHRGTVIAEIECGPALDGEKQARAALDSANAALAEAKSAREREAHLVERGISAKQTLETAMAREAAAKAAVTVEQARLDDARLIVSRCSVRSSQDGIVLRLLRRQGDIVDGTSATAIAEIADPAAAEVALAAGAADLSRVVVGQAVKLAFVSQEGTSFVGTVLSAPPMVDRATGLGTVHVALAPGVRPVLGALVTATIDLASARAVVAVPSAAIRSAGGDKSEVVLCSSGTARLRAVQVGAPLGDGGLTVVEGIAVGDRVAADGALGIEDGTSIREVDR